MARVDLSDLSLLLDARTRASQTKLHQLTTREAALNGLLNELSDRQNVGTVPDLTAQRTALDFQNELRHLRWVDQRRAMINIELAQIRAMADMARQDLFRHLARQSALDQVNSIQTAKDRRIAERRKTYGS